MKTMKTLKTWRTWTHREEQTLIAMRQEGRSAPEIARTLGRGLPSVKNRIGQLRGLAKKYRRVAMLQVDLCGPHSLKELAQKYGIKYGSVKAAKRRARRRGAGCIMANSGTRGRATLPTLDSRHQEE